VAAVILAVVGTGGWVFYQNWDQRRNEQQTQALLAAIEQDEGPAPLLEYAEFAGADHAMLARLIAAGLLSDSGETAKAIEQYEQIIAASGVSALYRDLAAVLKTGLELDTAPAGKLRDQLAPLAKDSNPWRYSAQELLALLEAREGNFDQAVEILTSLRDDKNTPVPVKSRASALLQVYATPVYQDTEISRDIDG